jgi:DNA-binding beta-propeller fold protein YncE
MSVQTSTLFAVRFAFLFICIIGSVNFVSAQSAIADINVGPSPTAIAVNPVTNRIYVLRDDPAPGNMDRLTAIDGAANSVLYSLDLGNDADPAGIAVDSTTNRVYFVNRGLGELRVVNGASTTGINAMIGVAGVGARPTALALDENTDRLFVAVDDPASGGMDTVRVLSGTSLSTFFVFELGLDANPSAVAVNPATTRVYVVNAGDSTVDMFDGAAADTASSSPASAGMPDPTAIAVNPATNRIYVTNPGSGHVFVIDGATNIATSLTTASPPTVLSPSLISVNPVTNRIYVANGTANITAIRGDTLAMQTIPVGTSVATAIAVNTTTNHVYVAQGTAGSNFMTVINGADDTTVGFEVGVGPMAIAVNETTNRAYTANPPGNSVTVIAGATITPVIEWLAPAPIVVGTPLSGTQLNATATLSNTSVAGAFVYSPPAGTVLAAGVHTLSVTFTPSDPNLNTVTATTTLTVTAAPGADFSLSPDPIDITISRQGDTALAVLTVRSMGTAPFDGRVTFSCRTLPGFDVPVWVSCNSPVADFSGNTDPNAARNVTVSIFTDGRTVAVAAPPAGGIRPAMLFAMLPIVGLLVAARRSRKMMLPLVFAIASIAPTLGCSNPDPLEPPPFTLRIQGIGDGGAPVHSVVVTVRFSALSAIGAR